LSIETSADHGLEKTRKLGDVNYAVACEMLGETVGLADDLDGLYRLLGELIAASGLGPDDEVVAGLYFLLFSRYQLPVGLLSLLRGHRNDSFSHTRQAIESAAFAARIARHPRLALVWLKSRESDAAFREYREKFKPGKLFPADHTILGRLYERYDSCSSLSHPSLAAIAGHAIVHAEGDTFEAGFNYFQFKQGDLSEPARTFLWIVDTHLQLVRVFARVFDKAVDGVTRWRDNVATFESRLVTQKQVWHAVILEG
jgi:hypothetical protein